MPALPRAILFVCLGNICRSPLMEGLARARRGQDAGDIELDSAGTGDWHSGDPADPRTIAVAARHGIDISAQRARQIRRDDFHRFDLILCADRQNLAALRAIAPDDARAECALFLNWTGIETGGEVPDPYTGGTREFEAVFALVDRGAMALWQRWRSDARTHPSRR